MPWLRAGDEPLSEQRLTIGGGTTRAPAWRPGGRTGLERGLDSVGDELRGLRVDDDVRRRRARRTTCPAGGGAACRPLVAGEGTGGIGLGHTGTMVLGVGRRSRLIPLP